MKNIVLLLIMFLTLSTFSQEKDAEYYNNFMLDSLYNGKIEEERDYRLMIEYLNEAIRLDSTEVTYYNNRAFAHYKEYNNLQAIKDYRYALKLDSTSIENASLSYYWMSKNFYYIDNYESALSSINKAIEIDSTDEKNFIQKAEVLLQSGYYEESKKNLEIAIALSYETPELKKSILNLESLNKKSDYKKTGNFIPYTKISLNDSLDYPIKIGVEFNLYSINLNKIEDGSVKIQFSPAIYSKFDPQHVSGEFAGPNYYSDSIAHVTDLSKNIAILTNDSSPLKYDFSYSGWTNKNIKNTQLFMYYPENDINEYEFQHNWDMADFPFDTQKLRVTIQAAKDSSIYAFEKFQNPGLKNHFKEVTGLPVGMQVEKVNYYNEFFNSDWERQFSPNGERKVVLPLAVFEIVISRSGSLLFIKLFLGTFLAYIMSLSAFTISKRNFPSRIDVSVGALFIAVGNKYFVESSTPMVQILTKADIINNLSLLLIIMNVVFIISQHRKEINIGKFEDSKYTLKFSAALLAALVFITIIF